MKFENFDSNLTEWERLLFFSRPQDQFRLDWSNYATLDFGNSFLPHANKIENNGLKIYDGANLFESLNWRNSNILKLEENTIFKITVYTYPEGAVIEENIDRIKVSSNEVCALLQIAENDKIEIQFILGKKFKLFLDNYFRDNGRNVDVSKFEKKIFETDKRTFHQYFTTSVNHQITLIYFLTYFEVEINTEFDDGGVRIEKVKDQNTLVPLGVDSYKHDVKNKGKEANESLLFEIEILENGIEELTIEVMNELQVYSEYPAGLQDSNGRPISNPSVYTSGTYYFAWDGFDKNDVYDSKELIAGNFKVQIKTKTNKILKTTESKEFKFKNAEADWIDIVINRTTKRVDVKLRVDLTEGKEIGTQVACENPGNCVWTDISLEALAFYPYAPITVRTQTFSILKAAALVGIDKFWSRNQNTYGKNVTIDGVDYEVYVKSEISEKGLKAPKITYVTNDKELRSRNFAFSRILFYNVGYAYDRNWEKYQYYLNPVALERYNNKGWYYINENIADFEMTAAHEVGHEILKAFGGLNYSYKHKDSTTLLTQKGKGLTLPSPPDEIDLMKYYSTYYDIPRTIAAKEDVLSFFWISKLKVK